MADIADWTYAKLAADAGVSALVSTRIYPIRMPQSPTLPLITYQQVAAEYEHAMGSDPNVEWARMQVTSWAETLTSARSLAKKVKACLRRATGTAASTVVQHSRIEMQIDGYEDGPQRYRVDMDFMFGYEEA